MLDASKNKQQSNITQKHFKTNPKTYFDLIQLVGSHGKYQFNMFLIFSSVLFITGTMLLNTSFLFLNQQFQCKNSGLLSNNCQQLMCSLQQNQWEKYLVQKQEGLKSAAQQFGPFACDEQIYLDLSKSSVYFGSFIGLICFSTISDNYGRKKTLVLSMSLATLGSYIVSSSQNIIMLSFGLICSGAGINTASATVFLYFPQVVQHNLRQKYSILIQVAYNFGGMLIILLYYLIGHWRIISILSTTIPITVILFFIIIYVEETPQFLLAHQDDKKILKSLNRIGKINFKIDQIITQQNISSVRHYCNKESLFKNFQKKLQITPWDLIKYPSLRLTTICVCCLGFITFSNYYGPIIIIDSIGFNLFISGFVIQLSELVIFLPSYYFISQIKRQKAGIYSYLLASICAFALLFIIKPENCQICFESIMELIIVFAFRVAIAFYLIIFMMYIVELFPSSASGLGNGFAQASGTIGSTLNPIILGGMQRYGVNAMSLFTIYGIIGIMLASLLRQTQGCKIKAQICEIQQLLLKRQQNAHQQKKLITEQNIQTKLKQRQT